jgi:hypothetical protein
MRRTGQAAEPCQRCNRFLCQWNAYALAAGAAGVGLIALSEPAAAEIVYTPVHKTIENGESYRLDFIPGGVTNLTIRNIPTSNCTFDTCFALQSLGAVLSGSNRVVHNIYGAVAMKQGMKIGPADDFENKTQRMVWTYGNAAIGSWIDVKDRFLGVEFKIKGEVHYGWARLNVQLNPPEQITASLTGYAYETVPNQAIMAGETKEPDATHLGLLDGSAGLGKLALGRK